MSDLTLILLLLATFALMVGCLLFAMAKGHERMDEIVSGVVNGIPTGTKYRWLLFYLDYSGYFLVCVALLGVFALGFFKVAVLANDPNVAFVAYLCGGATAVGGAAMVTFVASWAVHMVSVLRQAEGD